MSLLNVEKIMHFSNGFSVINKKNNNDDDEVLYN